MQTCQLAMAKPPKHDSGLEYLHAVILPPPQAICGTTMHAAIAIEYVWTQCPQNPLLWAVIWAICTELTTVQMLFQLMH